jgi:hypothetical protein
MRLEPAKRPLLLGLTAAVIGLVIRLRWPPTPMGDAVWALALIFVAVSLVWFDPHGTHAPADATHPVGGRRSYAGGVGSTRLACRPRGLTIGNPLILSLAAQTTRVRRVLLPQYNFAAGVGFVLSCCERLLGRRTILSRWRAEGALVIG